MRLRYSLISAHFSFPTKPGAPLAALSTAKVYSYSCFSWSFLVYTHIMSQSSMAELSHFSPLSANHNSSLHVAVSHRCVLRKKYKCYSDGWHRGLGYQFVHLARILCVLYSCCQSILMCNSISWWIPFGPIPLYDFMVSQKSVNDEKIWLNDYLNI